jgi:aryl-alcohol dehydrogenase-like predicted oxidoreductase
VCTSVQFSLAKQNEPMWKGALSANDEDVEWMRRNRFPLLAWSSLAGGFFSGRYAPDRTDNKDMVRVYYSGSNWEKYRRAEELARRKGFTTAEIALAYVIRQPFPSCALVGPLKVEELESGLRALDVRLMPEEIEWLELKTPNLRQGDGNGP